MKRTALITGASSGIGAACVEMFFAAGFNITALARRKDKLDTIREKLQASHDQIQNCACDVTDLQQVEEAFEQHRKKFKSLDVLVNNAGYAAYGKLEDLSLDRFRRNIETNYLGVVACTKTALPLLKLSTQNPSIVMVSSIVGRRGFPGASSYCASKFALEGFSESLRLELKNSGISLSVVNPGVTRSEFFEVADGQRPKEFGATQKGMPAKTVARIILNCAEHPRRNVYLSLAGKAGIFLQWLSPRLFDFILQKKLGH